MPNDAKLGMILGVGLVLGAAVLFFQREEPIHAANNTTTQVPPMMSNAATSITPVIPSAVPHRVDVRIASR